MPRTKLRQGQTQTSKEEGGSTARTTAQIEKYYSGGKREFTYKKNDRGKVIKVELKGGGMSSGQAKLAAKAPPPNKIDAKDFAVLRKEKAKGRGMGLQDESVKPGKVQKAALGMLALGIGAKKLMDKNKKELPPGIGAAALLTKKKEEILGKKMGGVMKAKRGKMFDGYLSTFDASAEASTPKAQRGVTTIVGVRPGAKIGKGKKKFKSMEAMRTAKGFKTIDGKQETSSEFNKRRMALAAAKKTASASRIGKIALGIGTAGVAASQYLKSKMNKKKDVKKKMGGGMMQRPMGYKHGTEPGAGPLGGIGKAGRSGRGRPTRSPGPLGAGAVGAVAAKEISADNKRRIAYMDGAKETVTGGGMKADRFKEGLNIKGSKSSAMKFYARGDTDHGKLGQKKYKSLKNNTYSKGGAMKKGYMSGGMMKPMGYKSGTMVKARGCKLGRTRPTKIT